MEALAKQAQELQLGYEQGVNPNLTEARKTMVELLESTTDVFEALDLSPEQFLTDGGLVNRGKLRAAFWYPHEYLPEGHWMRAADSQSPMAEALRDCRTCRHYTEKTGGCMSIVRCVQGSEYQRNGVRAYWDDK